MIQDTKETMRFIAKYPLDGTKEINANIIFNDYPIAVLDLLIKPVKWVDEVLDIALQYLPEPTVTAKVINNKCKKRLDDKDKISTH